MFCHVRKGVSNFYLKRRAAIIKSKSLCSGSDEIKLERGARTGKLIKEL